MGIIIEIIKELNIEVSSPNVFQAVVAKQYDMNTRFIKATFVDNGDKIYIDPDATVKVIINALRPDGESKGFDGEVNQDGTVTVPLHSWMLDQVGTVTCDISVIDTETDDNRKLTTTSFTLFVEKAAWGGGDITSDSQYDVLVELLNTCSTAGEVAEEALQKSNEAIKRAESAKGVYIGSGDMPEGYTVQIDDSGSVLEMDTDLSLTSTNPVQNSVVTAELMMLDSQVNNLADRDYIIEQGRDGIWTYRKWASGVSECWTSAMYNAHSIIKVSDTYCYSVLSITGHSYEMGLAFPNGLFVSTPCVQYSIANDKGTNGVGVGQGIFKEVKACPTKDSTGCLYFDLSTKLYESTEWTKEQVYEGAYRFTFADGQYIPIHASIEAKGRWKE